MSVQEGECIGREGKSCEGEMGERVGVQKKNDHHEERKLLSEEQERKSKYVKKGRRWRWTQVEDNKRRLTEKMNRRRSRY